MLGREACFRTFKWLGLLWDSVLSAPTDGHCSDIIHPASQCSGDIRNQELDQKWAENNSTKVGSYRSNNSFSGLLGFDKVTSEPTNSGNLLSVSSQIDLTGRTDATWTADSTSLMHAKDLQRGSQTEWFALRCTLPEIKLKHNDSVPLLFLNQSSSGVVFQERAHVCQRIWPPTSVPLLSSPGTRTPVEGQAWASSTAL